MKLEKKKALAARTLGVGKGRIVLNSQRLSEIKEAITKQDIKDLHASGAILVAPIKGRKTIVRRKNRRRAGSVRKKVLNKKRNYISLTRKLRAHIKSLRNKNSISEDLYIKLRKEIRARSFRDLIHMKERIAEATKK
jgi:large subunit ribosomal protein L19e